MRLGTYDIHPGIAITIAMLAIALVCFAGLWLKNSKTSTALKSLAQAEAWTWIGPAPDALIDALARLHVSYKWNASLVMSVNGLSDTIYLFHFERSKGSERNSSTYKGIAALIPGRTAPNSPVYAIGQWPPAPMRKLVAMRPDLLDGVGSAAFRQRYYVTSAAYRGPTQEQTPGVATVDVSPVFEQELLAWDGPGAAGLPDGWSGIEIRDRQVMVFLNNSNDVSAAAWYRLITKSEALSRILAKR